MALKAVPPVTPGNYPGGGQASLLRTNESQFLFQQQLVPAGNSVRLDGSNLSASIAVQLERIKAFYYPFGASMQIWFTDVNQNASNPGAFEIDWQTSDIDTDAQYSTISALNGGLNASFSGRIELPTFWARFSRAYVKTLANSVYVNVLITR